MAITKAPDKINKSTQEMQNLGFDTEFNVPVSHGLGYDGLTLQRVIASSVALKITESGSNTYIAIASPGTAQATARWQCRKIDESSGIVITWADGDANFDNVATDLTALSYS